MHSHRHKTTVLAITTAFLIAVGCAGTDDAPETHLESDTQAVVTSNTCCPTGWTRVLATAQSSVNKNGDGYVCQRSVSKKPRETLKFTHNTSPCKDTADLSITKTDGTATFLPGTSTTYTIVVSNAGPGAVVGASVTDPLPPEISGATWSCVASAGSSCGSASGNNSIATTVDLAAGGTATFTMAAQITAVASGTLANTATVTAPASVVDPNPANNTATDTDTTPPAPLADLSIIKTDGVTSVTPGTSTTYTMVVSNAGPSAVVGATVADTLPASISSATWTCVATAGSSCGAASGNNSIASTVNLAIGGNATFTLVGQISAAVSGTLVNTATVTAPTGVVDPAPANNTATDTDTFTTPPQADLSITKSNGTTTVVPGTTTSYTIVVSNAGPSAVEGATVVDTLPTALTNAGWTCVASTGSSCPATGSGSISTAISLASGGTASFTVSAQVSPQATGTVANTATVAAPVGVVDPNAANNTATDTDTVAPAADLAILKTDGVTTVVSGQQTIYTIVVTNLGPSPVTGALVRDDLPPTIVSASWTCLPSPGANCTRTGAGNILTAVDLPVGANATFTLTAQTGPGLTGILANTATVTAPGSVTDPVSSNNAATDVDSFAQ